MLADVGEDLRVNANQFCPVKPFSHSRRVIDNCKSTDFCLIHWLRHKAFAIASCVDDSVSRQRPPASSALINKLHNYWLHLIANAINFFKKEQRLRPGRPKMWSCKTGNLR